MSAASAAICRLVTIAGMYVGACRAALNQQAVKPIHPVMFPIWAGGMLQMLDPWKPARAADEGLLKAKTAITRIGRNRNPYTTTAHAVNACLAVSRRLRTELLLFGGDQDVHQQRPGDHTGQGEPERDLAERGERACSQVGGGFDQRPVHPFQ